MGSTFSGLNTALTSLYAQRRGLDVTGQNIANASTEGYTRQRVRMVANNGGLNPGVYSTTDQVGAGVKVASLERGRSGYLEERGRTEHGNAAYLANQTAAYSQIEDVFAEPSDTAIQARMHDMWDAWNDVANNWQDPSTRSSLIERATTVATSLNDAQASLSNQFTANGNEMSTYADQVNTLATNIAKMNQIVVAKQANLQPNEMMDDRDRAVMQLAELAGATTIEQPNGALNVFLGQGPLVAGFTARQVKVVGPPTLDGISATSQVGLQWTDTGGAVAAGGAMGSMIDTMNTVIPNITAQLDKVAQKLADTVNVQHRGGYSADGTTDLDFFTGEVDATVVTAKSIKVAVSDPAQVAFSSQNPISSDPNVAGSINHDVADKLTDIGASGTGPDQTYQQMIGQLGVAAQASGRRSDIQNSVRDQVDTDRTAESGVNLDEEMTNLLTYQRGYEAASRVLTTVDSMLDQLINRTGLVGR